KPSKRGARREILELRRPSRASFPTSGNGRRNTRNSSLKSSPTKLEPTFLIPPALFKSFGIKKSPTIFQARPGLIFRASSRFVGRDNFVAPKKRRHGYFVALGEICGNCFQVLLVKAHGTHFDGTIGVDQKILGHVSQAVGVGDDVAVRVVEENGKSDAVFFREFVC